MQGRAAAALTGEGQAAVFIAVDHCSAECVGIHAARAATRFEALEPIRQGVRERFGTFANGIAIGLSLTLIHLISIPVTNTSVNPARSTGPALLVGDWAMAQLWLFWLAPIAGAVIGAVIYRYIGSPED